MTGGGRPGVWAFLEDALSEADDVAGLSRAPMDHDDYILPRLDREALAPVVRGEMLLFVRANRAADLRQIIALKGRRPSLKLAILDGREAWRVAGELAAAGIPVILNPIYNLPASFESMGARRDNAALLREAGVKIAFSSIVHSFDMSHNARLLPQAAGLAVAAGLPWDAALEAMTRGPAEIFGIEADYGSLAPGRVADVVVWDGDPLEVMTAPAHVIIAGNEIELTSRQTELRDRYSPLRKSDMPRAYE